MRATGLVPPNLNCEIELGGQPLVMGKSKSTVPDSQQHISGWTTLQTSLSVIGGLVVLVVAVVAIVSYFATKVELKESQALQEEERRKLVCFVCRVPSLAEDSKCAENNCSSKATFDYNGKSYEAIVVADPSATFRDIAAASDRTSIRIEVDGEITSIDVAPNFSPQASLYHPVLLKIDGKPVEFDTAKKTISSSIKAGSRWEIRSLKRD